MNTKRIRVLIADDHSVVRMGIAALLSAEHDLEVVGEAKNGEEVLSLAPAVAPDVVVMDLMMPKKDGITTTAELQISYPTAKVLILTSFSLSTDIATAIQRGAYGAVLKNAENSDLVAAIRAVAAGRHMISPEIRRILKEDPPLPELSSRQHTILKALARGFSNSDIAKQLSISVASVKTHVLALFAKLGVANRAEAVAVAMRKHLLDEE